MALTIASPMDEPILDEPVRAYSAMQRGDRARAFRRAMRHSRWVRFWRWAVPLSIVGGVAIGVVAERLGPFYMFKALPVDFSNLVVSGTKITMQSPRVAGFTPDGRPYE